MQEVRPKFSVEEYESLKKDADRLRISIRQLVHDRAVNCNGDYSHLYGIQALSTEMALIRSEINQVIHREMDEEIRLYEDDIIRLEKSMADLEQVVAKHISRVLRKELPNHGQPAL